MSVVGVEAGFCALFRRLFLLPSVVAAKRASEGSILSKRARFRPLVMSPLLLLLLLRASSSVEILVFGVAGLARASLALFSFSLLARASSVELLEVLSGGKSLVVVMLGIISVGRGVLLISFVSVGGRGRGLASTEHLVVEGAFLVAFECLVGLGDELEALGVSAIRPVRVVELSEPAVRCFELLWGGCLVLCQF